MKIKDIELTTEIMLLASCIYLTDGQKSMVQGRLSQNGKRRLNMWMQHGRALIKQLHMDVNDEFMQALVEPLHAQMDENRKALIKLYEQDGKNSKSE